MESITVIIVIIDIGSGDEKSLLCITDNPDRVGEWYFLNISMVRVNGDGGSFKFYRDI